MTAGTPVVRRPEQVPPGPLAPGVAAMQMLNDLGVVVDDRTEAGTLLNH